MIASMCPDRKQLFPESHWAKGHLTGQPYSDPYFHAISECHRPFQLEPFQAFLHFARFTVYSFTHLKKKKRLIGMDRRVFPGAGGGAVQSSNGLHRGLSSGAGLVSQPSGLDNKLKTIADSLDSSDLDDKGKNLIEQWRLYTKHFLHHHFLGGVYQVILLIISVLAAFQFIYNTYVESYRNQQVGNVQEVLTYIEVAFAGIFGFDWALSFFLADDRLQFFTRYANI